MAQPARNHLRSLRRAFVVACEAPCRASPFASTNARRGPSLRRGWHDLSRCRAVSSRALPVRAPRFEYASGSELLDIELPGYVDGRHLALSLLERISKTTSASSRSLIALLERDRKR